MSQDRSHPVAGELLAIDDLLGDSVFFRDTEHERLLMVQQMVLHPSTTALSRFSEFENTEHVHLRDKSGEGVEKELEVTKG